ncbi:nitroreductase family protein [Lentibacter sp. XHP0401]|uniref:nitroreductase family protein n=1 Tax=Lentibacter sp. XHP0401 TaxID=2984334 RepID=UPI0021E98EAB|nr:nitroreductase family protein [Lentibacter sp. XHP0401]MCV2893551.1 nitroreductase family protein [Lentibacter sp. XHP0401]
MPRTNAAALEFLKTRRSRPAKTLAAPAPVREELEALLTIAARTPDHGKLEPWRFVVIQGESMEKLANAAQATAEKLGYDTEQTAKARSQFDQGICAVAVIESPVISEKIPAIEQTYSAGAVCLALLNAALASGWGANWLSGAISHERGFVEGTLGLTPHERIAGLIHIGTETNTPPERPRPDVKAKTTWL